MQQERRGTKRPAQATKSQQTTFKKFTDQLQAYAGMDIGLLKQLCAANGATAETLADLMQVRFRLKDECTLCLR